MLVASLAGFALAAWLAVLLLPSRPWSTRERLEPSSAADGSGAVDLSTVTVLIPARNEAKVIAGTLRALAAQGRNLRVILIDDESDDGTAASALAANAAANGLALEIVRGEPLPAGWGGKLWALSQGLQRVDRDYCLLLDAEIRLDPGVAGALLDKARRESRAMVSVMARLRCRSFWESLLVPPFIFFFKLLYPFAKIGDPGASTAGAAGGCILIRTRVLRQIGGFEAIQDALIDDCTLAAHVKAAGHSIWLGLSNAVTSARSYERLGSFRRMVARTAFTQLNYSTALLIAVACLMLVLFVVPVLGLLTGPLAARLTGGGAVVAMATVYAPTVRFYRLPLLWTLTLPFAAVLFLAMTVESALNYWRGRRAVWKGRTYTAR